MLNSPNEILEEKTSDVSILNLRKDSIITLEPKLGVTEQTLDSMKKDLEVFKEWAKDGKLGFLVDSRRLEKFDSNVRIYAQNNSPLFSDKYAIIISSGISSFLANMFIYINRPAIPTKTFTNKNDAIYWLKN